MNNCTHIVNLREAKDEADRLSRVLKRNVEVAHVSCPCDYSKDCYCCAGSGTYYELRYAFCNHVVQEGDDLECAANDCESREREASMVERPDTWPRVSAPLQSCEQIGIQQTESEAA